MSEHPPPRVGGPPPPQWVEKADDIRSKARLLALWEAVSYLVAEERSLREGGERRFLAMALDQMVSARASCPALSPPERRLQREFDELRAMFQITHVAETHHLHSILHQGPDPTPGFRAWRFRELGDPQDEDAGDRGAGIHDELVRQNPDPLEHAKNLERWHRIVAELETAQDVIRTAIVARWEARAQGRGGGGEPAAGADTE